MTAHETTLVLIEFAAKIAPLVLLLLGIRLGVLNERRRQRNHRRHPFIFRS